MVAKQPPMMSSLYDSSGPLSNVLCHKGPNIAFRCVSKIGIRLSRNHHSMCNVSCLSQLASGLSRVTHSYHRACLTHHTQPVECAGVGVVAQHSHSASAQLCKPSSVKDAFSHEQCGGEIPAFQTPHRHCFAVTWYQLLTTEGVVTTLFVVFLHLACFGAIGLIS